MNGHNSHTPAKKTGTNPTPTKNGVTTTFTTPTLGKPSNAYIPTYTAPPEPMVLPAPNVDIEIPQTMEIVTLEDLIQRITANASVLLPGVPIKITTAITPSDRFHHALVVVPKNTERETSRWKVEIRGPGVNIERVGESQARRKALEALLELLERRIGKDLL